MFHIWVWTLRLAESLRLPEAADGAHDMIAWQLCPKNFLPSPQPLAVPMHAAVENPLQPVQWVRIDPGGEWLCSVWLEQPLRCWVAQLAHSRDVVAQVSMGLHAGL